MPSVKLKHENGSGLYSPGSSSGLDHTNNCFESDGSSKWSIKSSTIQRSLLFLHTTKSSSKILSNRCHHQKSILQKRSSSKKVSSASSIKNSLVSCSFMTNRKSQTFSISNQEKFIQLITCCSHQSGEVRRGVGLWTYQEQEERWR